MWALRLAAIAAVALSSLRGHTQTLPSLELQAGLIQPSYPFSEMGELFRSPNHTQFLGGLTWKRQTDRRINWMYGVRTGFLYHQLIQAGVPIQGHAGAYARLAGPLGLEAGLLGGYLHSFPLTRTYRMEDGRYQRSGRLGRPQAQIGLQAGPSFRLGSAGHELFLHYQFWLQVPFINEYVPALPYNGLALGLRLGRPANPNSVPVLPQ